MLDVEVCRHPDHLARWFAAMRDGTASALKCEAVLRTGRRCRSVAMRDSVKLGTPRCRHHCRGAFRDQIDEMREPRLLKLSLRVNLRHQRAAAVGLAAIARRRLHRAWLLDPTIPGSTLPDLSPADCRRVTAWLAERGIREGRALPDTGRPATARCWDRLQWAAVMRLGGRLTDEVARRRVLLAQRDDVKWWRFATGVIDA